MDVNKVIGARIETIRMSQRETQEELANAVGVSREVINHWEHGTRNIKADAISKIAKHFCISTDVLFGVNFNDTEERAMKICYFCTGDRCNSDDVVSLCDCYIMDDDEIKTVDQATYVLRMLEISKIEKESLNK